jgi:CRISPR-associated protein Csb1
MPHVLCVTDRSPTIDAGNVTLNRDDLRDRVVTTSLTEGHRIASDYFLDARRLVDGNVPEEGSFRDLLRREFQLIEVKKDKTYFIPPEAWWSIYTTLFRYDPNSLVHGVLFAKEQIKISRVLTAHLEAFGAARVGRSGVKFDQLKKTLSGQPIFGVDEETAREIRATFIIDLALLRSYGRDGRDGSAGVGLTRNQKQLLLALALWKVRELLGRTFSYRSGCKLRTRELAITTDESEKPLATSLPDPGVQQAISVAGFTGSPVTRVYYPFDELFKPSKDDQVGGADEEAEVEGGEGEGEA